MMTQEDFKAYLDMVVEKAFRKGVMWAQDKYLLEKSVPPFRDAVKESQDEILELKKS